VSESRPSYAASSESTPLPDRASQPGERPLLRLEGLTKEFRSKDERTLAVDDVALEVARGELVTLLGPSGCGKTTTLRMIAGFETPTAGHILLDGRDITRIPPRSRGTGMVFQNYALFPHLNVFENVAFGLKARGAARAEVAERVDAVLTRVDLPGYAARRVQDLSGGQQQRVALARALAPEPPLLLLDEPLSNLDAALRERTRAELHDLLKRLEITSVFVTHDQEEAFALSDRVALMRNGRLQQVGTPEALYTRPANAFVAGFLGRANFVAAEVMEAGETLTCTVAGAGGWRAWPAPELADAAPGTAVRLLARPEALSMVADNGVDAAAEALAGKVVERRFAGAVTWYRVVAAGADLLVSAPAGSAAEGDQVTLRPRGTLYALPAEG
jgi:ABC-type Fe3+/spermidine/putrescine transport system ATPase subunit